MLYDCCMRPKASKGCETRFDCCDKSGEGCEDIFECCNKMKGEKGCVQKCRNCRRVWGTGPGCIYAV